MKLAHLWKEDKYLQNIQLVLLRCTALGLFPWAETELQTELPSVNKVWETLLEKKNNSEPKRYPKLLITWHERLTIGNEAAPLMEATWQLLWRRASLIITNIINYLNCFHRFIPTVFTQNLWTKCLFSPVLCRHPKPLPVHCQPGRDFSSLAKYVSLATASIVLLPFINPYGVYFNIQYKLLR